MFPWTEVLSSPDLLLSGPPALRFVTMSFLAAFGAVWGSYLNVVVHRLPRGLSTAYPGSHCPRCAARIRPWQNVPVISFLLLRARCATCGGKISWRYPLVEATTAAIFLLAGLRFSSWPAIVLAWILAFVWLALALIDLDWRGLPLRLTLPTLLLALAAQPLVGWIDPSSAILASLGGGLVLEGTARGWKAATGARGFGTGDPPMLAMVGAALGTADLLRTVIYALLAALVVGLPARRLGLLDRRRALPFGLFAAVAALYVLLLDPVGVGR